MKVLPVNPEFEPMEFSSEDEGRLEVVAECVEVLRGTPGIRIAQHREARTGIRSMGLD